MGFAPNQPEMLHTAETSLCSSQARAQTLQRLELCEPWLRSNPDMLLTRSPSLPTHVPFSGWLPCPRHGKVRQQTGPWDGGRCLFGV